MRLAFIMSHDNAYTFLPGGSLYPAGSSVHRRFSAKCTTAGSGACSASAQCDPHHPKHECWSSSCVFFYQRIMRTFEGVRGKLRRLVASPCNASFWQIWMLVFGDPEVCFVHPSGDIFLRYGPELFYSMCPIPNESGFLRKFQLYPTCNAKLR
jgi:hypothetical protein